MYTQLDIIKFNLGLAIVLELYLILCCYRDFISSNQLNHTITNIETINSYRPIKNNIIDKESFYLDNTTRYSIIQNQVSQDLYLFNFTDSTNFTRLFTDHSIMITSLYLHHISYTFNYYGVSDINDDMSLIKINNRRDLYLDSNFVYYFSILLYQIYLVKLIL